MGNVNPYNKLSKDYWVWEAEKRGIVIEGEDEKMADIKAKVEKFDSENTVFKTGKEEIIKILVPAGTRLNSQRILEETEIEIEAKDWDKYSHIAVKVSL